MAPRNRKTQRRNRSRRNRVHRGGAITCKNAYNILIDPKSPRIKRMAAEVQAKQCNSEYAAVKTAETVKKTQNAVHKASSLGVVTNSSGVVAPNKRYYNYRAREGEYAKCGAEGVNSNGHCINGGIMPEYVE